MRRIRKDATKVWHNPEIVTRGSGQSALSGGAKEAARENAREQKQHRAALEALFSRKKVADGPEAASGESTESAKPNPGRIVLASSTSNDPRGAERQRLLSRLLIAEGRPSISKATDEFLKAGFTLPHDQEVYLQLLEHRDEEKICTAIDGLSDLLSGELPKRRAILDSRLRRIEQFAEENQTRSSAERLRRKVSGRPDGSAPVEP